MCGLAGMVGGVGVGGGDLTVYSGARHSREAGVRGIGRRIVRRCLR